MTSGTTTSNPLRTLADSQPLKSSSSGTAAGFDGSRFEERAISGVDGRFELTRPTLIDRVVDLRAGYAPAVRRGAPPGLRSCAARVAIRGSRERGATRGAFLRVFCVSIKTTRSPSGSGIVGAMILPVRSYQSAPIPIAMASADRPASVRPGYFRSILSPSLYSCSMSPRGDPSANSSGRQPVAKKHASKDGRRDARVLSGRLQRLRGERR